MEKETKKYKITIIDDDNHFLQILRQILVNEKYTVFSFNDAISFSKSMINSAISCDLIITDINMPIKSGIEAVNDLIAKNKLNNIPVIFLTGRDDEETIGKAFEINTLFFEYLIKPLNPRLLLNMVQKLLMLSEYNSQIIEANKALHIISQGLIDGRIIKTSLLNINNLTEKGKLNYYLSFLRENINKSK